MNPHPHADVPFLLTFVAGAPTVYLYRAENMTKPVAVRRELVPPTLVGLAVLATASAASWQEHATYWALVPTTLESATSATLLRQALAETRPSYLAKVEAWIATHTPTAAQLQADVLFYQRALAVMGVSRVAQLLGVANATVRDHMATTMPTFDNAARRALKHFELNGVASASKASKKGGPRELPLAEPDRHAQLIAQVIAALPRHKLAREAQYIRTWVAAHYVRFSDLGTDDQLFFDAVAMLGFEAVRQLLGLAHTNAVRALLETRCKTRQRSFQRKLEIMLALHSARENVLPTATHVAVVPYSLFVSFARANELSVAAGRRLFYSHHLRVARAHEAVQNERAQAFAQRRAELLAAGFRPYNTHYLASAAGEVFKLAFRQLTIRPVQVITRTNNRGKVSLCVSVGHGHVSYLVRVVAELFVPNPHGFRYVTLIDNDYQNCAATNIMWIESPSDGRFVEHRTEKWIDWILAHYPADGMNLEALATHLANQARAANFHATTTNLTLRIQSVIHHWADNGAHTLFSLEQDAQGMRVYLRPEQLARYRAEHWKGRGGPLGATQITK